MSEQRYATTLEEVLALRSEVAGLRAQLEQLQYGIAAVAFALGWTDLKGISLEQHARNTTAQLASARKALAERKMTR